MFVYILKFQVKTWNEFDKYKELFIDVQNKLADKKNQLEKELLPVYWTNVSQKNKTQAFLQNKELKLCIWLITLQLTLKLWLVIRNALY